uniref:Uncharacterized protein n=1 Tax=virus sp. ctrcb4 TaxID=2825824 RepID=A0A8S5RPP8_9VIRU|nr:MAG TPA: hypothetical protein [virus sp. ctrcb4]
MIFVYSLMKIHYLKIKILMIYKQRKIIQLKNIVVI